MLSLNTLKPFQGILPCGDTGKLLQSVEHVSRRHEALFLARYLNLFYHVILTSKLVLISTFSNIKTNLSTIKRKWPETSQEFPVGKKKILSLCCPNAQHVKLHFESVSPTDNEVVTWCRTVTEMDGVKMNPPGCALRYVYTTRRRSLITFILCPHSQSVFPAWLETRAFFFLHKGRTHQTTHLRR